MEFKPRYPQPFTILQAIELDVSVITEEIARLQNSISHLKDTQQSLQTYLSTEDDAELATALKENEDVIASQQERITILQFALRGKGIIGNEHYSLPTPSRTEPDELTPTENREDGGIDL
ncbi:hypothetical protein M378DRAFT_927770 [Amanita muscaria Koide BX008]|uniref:Uncharacterized protein n=1 Tax=Amanita muscaria (strain Koide BX008) TaxID=946122 RepID=A0A0C2X1R2_AMAMK|nr:hypothetical protein M378DRAFT_927770 [Amanita muscaria Koide BX008]